MNGLLNINQGSMPVTYGLLAQQPQQQQGFFQQFQQNPNAAMNLGATLLMAAGQGRSTGEGLGMGLMAFSNALAESERQKQQARTQQLQEALLMQKIASANQPGFKGSGLNAQLANMQAQRYMQQGISPDEAFYRAGRDVMQSAPQYTKDPATGALIQLPSQQLPFVGSMVQPQASMAQPQAGLLDTMRGITMKNESGGRRYADNGQLLESPKGALGEMQVLPETARDPGFGVQPAQTGSPDELARVGNDYLAKMVDIYQDPAKAWAAYNAGPGALDRAVAQYGDAWLQNMPRETQDYVAKNMAALGRPPAMQQPYQQDMQPPAMQPLPQLTPIEQAAQSEATIKSGVKKYDEITKQAETAPDAIRNAEQALAILDSGFEGGKLAGMRAEYQRLKGSTNPTPEEQKFLQDYATLERYAGNSTFDYLAKFTGAISEGERAFAAGLAASPLEPSQAIRTKVMMDYVGAQANLRRQQLADEWTSAYGSLGKKNQDGQSFTSFLSQYVKDNPIVTPDLAQKFGAMYYVDENTNIDALPEGLRIYDIKNRKMGVVQ